MHVIIANTNCNVVDSDIINNELDLILVFLGVTLAYNTFIIKNIL